MLTTDFNSTMRAKGFAQNAAGEWVKVSSRPLASVPAPAPSKRIRQDAKPLMNKLESAWFDALNVQFPNYPRPRAQAKRYKIANGAWYKPDITATSWPQEVGPDCETAWECKGPDCMKNVARGKLAIKCAAAQWPEVAFFLVWKKSGQWQQQRVLP